MGDVFKALSDNTRRDILVMLAKKPANVNEIGKHFDMSRPAISRHLKVLRESELIAMKPGDGDGRHIDCYLQLEALQEVEAYIHQLERFWKSKLDGLGSYLDEKKNGH